MTEPRKEGTAREVNGITSSHETPSDILLGAQKGVLQDLFLCVPRGYGPRNRSDLDIGQGDITMDLQHVHLLKG